MLSCALTVHDAWKRFASTQALAGVGLELRRGECLALLGPNGAGKTTLVRAIGGRVRLDRGQIAIQAASSSSNGCSSLGVVPQEIAIYPLLTARENLEVFGALAGLRGRQLADRVAWALEWTELAERAREPVKRFSGGMKRRLNLACGVLHQPEVVLLDEPTVGVDPQSRQRIWEMLAELRARGVSLLLTSHQLDEAQQVCDRVVIIDGGKVIAAGTLEELVDRTIGAGRRVSIILEPEARESLRAQGFPIDDEDTLGHRLVDVGAELPPLLTRLGEAGGRIRDIRIETPGLQAVFLHLTGRELRE